MNEKEATGAIMQLEKNEIDANIQHITRALSQTADDHPNMRLLLACLGSAYNGRFDLLGEQDDIDKAIEYTHIALTRTPGNDPGLSSLLGDLGARYLKRYQRLGEMGDNDKAIEYLSFARTLTPNGHSSLPTLLGNLGACYSARFQGGGEPGGLEKAIEYESQALELTPDGHPDLLARLVNLSGSLSIRFQRLGGLEDLQKAIEYGSRAVELTPDGHPHLSTGLVNLAVALNNRFERVGDIADLDKAIEHQSRAVAMTPDGHPHLPTLLVNFAVSLNNRFERLGELGDLEKAIEHQSRALALTTDGHPDLSRRLTNIAASLINRFKRLGELGDLEKAIEHQSRALALTPEGHPHLSIRFTNLAVSYTNRFQCVRELGDLDKAIEYGSRAVELTPDGHQDLSTRLANLGLSLSNRFQSVGEIGDLEKAIKHQSQALALTPHGHPDLPRQLALLAMSHGYRFGRLRHPHALEKAIECMSRALELTPDGHPNFPDRHFPLAHYRLLQYQHTGDPSCLQQSLYSYRMASQSLAGSPRDKFMHAILWGKIASEESSLNCIEAYQTAIDLLPQFIWLGTTTIQRYQDLTSTGSFAINAALAAILASDYALALEWLEHTRCVVWNQSLMLRSPLDKLHSRDPALATRLKTVAAQLHHAGSEPRESQAFVSGSLSSEQVSQQHRRLAQEYSNLIFQARTLPGFDDFLQPIRTHDLVRAARTGPIVVITCHESRCDALIVVPGQDKVSHVPLPSFTGQKAWVARQEMEKLVRSSLQKERGVERRPVVEQEFEFQAVLASLWYDVVKPVLDYLGYTDLHFGESLPHITWCPTGILSFLPLHAAGDYDEWQSKTYNYVISSYTPTLTALLSSSPSSLSPDLRVLAIGQPHTPGHSRLPGTVQELEHLQGRISGRAAYSQLIGNQATTKAVLEAMDQHDWVHLACHAHQNVGDPTKSGFFLHDGTLDLASINQQSFKNKGLAYLSACQTATGDEKLPDEAIHLASGMLMAGYSSVIATMWSVMDDDAPFVADKVYEKLMKDGSVGSGEAGKALHYAVAELREKVGESEFERWVPYIHIGS